MDKYDNGQATPSEKMGKQHHQESYWQATLSETYRHAIWSRINQDFTMHKLKMHNKHHTMGRVSKFFSPWQIQYDDPDSNGGS